MAQGEVVVGVFSRDELSTGLVATHRAGFGPHARVLDSARGRLDSQLRKTGHVLPIAFADDDTDTVLIVITAPGRTTLASETLNRAGARAVFVAPRAPVQPAPASAVVPPEPPAAQPESPAADVR